MSGGDGDAGRAAGRSDRRAGRLAAARGTDPRATTGGAGPVWTGPAGSGGSRSVRQLGAELLCDQHGGGVRAAWRAVLRVAIAGRAVLCAAPARTGAGAGTV